MKRIIFISIILVISLFLMPLFMTKGGGLIGRTAYLPEHIITDGTEEWEETVLSGEDKVNTSPGVPYKQTGYTSDGETDVLLLRDGQVMRMRLDEYLVGVVAAEMPALFPEEALKAQAVAARTYTYNRMIYPSHDGADVCDNPAHCKAYTDPAEYAARFGDDTFINKINAAVNSTDAITVMYDNEPIVAVFHAISGGRTERAADVWGGDLPYLQSVESEGEESAAKFREIVSYSETEFKERFTEVYPSALFEGSADKWIADIKRSAAGGVMTMTVAGTETKGNEFRAIYRLNSTNFTVSAADGKIIIETLGYGHGVGMSQYGAKALAERGFDFEQILKHYYTGGELIRLTDRP